MELVGYIPVCGDWPFTAITFMRSGVRLGEACAKILDEKCTTWAISRSRLLRGDGARRGTPFRFRS
jgi:hypothetical protein